VSAGDGNFTENFADVQAAETEWLRARRAARPWRRMRSS
jgi:hypothetical protein